MKPRWKTHQIPEHKFDDFGVDDFVDYAAELQLRYALVFVGVFKDVLMYAAEVGVVVLRFFPQLQVQDLAVRTPAQDALDSGAFDATTYQSVLPIELARVAKWLVLLSVCVSYALLAHDMVKAKRAVLSRDVALAYTDTLAYNAYCIHSYAYFCFFCELDDWDRVSDRLAFFSFFGLRNWKRLFAAEAMRHALNLCALIDLFRLHMQRQGRSFGWLELVSFLSDCEKLQAIVILFATMTILSYVVRMLLLVLAGAVYIPLLLWVIRGNLKEYCCHIVDGRVAGLVHKAHALRYLAQTRGESPTVLLLEDAGYR